jgi:hypothetical protein
MRGENKCFLLSFFIRLVSIVKHSVTVRLVNRLSKVDLTGRLSVYFVLASTFTLSPPRETNDTENHNSK